MKSGEFRHKHLCDGITLNLGDACVYGCEFCSVEASMRQIDKPFVDKHNATNGTQHRLGDVVIRRKDAIEVLKDQLLDSKGKPRFCDPGDTRVVFSSTTVDVAANMELLRETAEACNLILAARELLFTVGAHEGGFARATPAQEG